MAEFYAYRIIAGKTTLDKIPELLKKKVAEILAQEGFTTTKSE